MVLLAKLLAFLGVYELARWRLGLVVRRRWQRSIGSFLRRHGVELEHFRFIDRVWVRQTLLQDPELDAFAAEQSKATGQSLGELRARMEEYLDEIVPYFNLFSYYKLGASVARAATRFCYELVFDAASLAHTRHLIPPGAVTVYVANHRSNADYVVLSVGTLRQVALSYAVGEWALVWPLDVLFRSFGSYFVRRGEKDPLYHAVLERYLQLVASRGLTTAFFLEGGLSRDGALRAPKIGLLDYLIGMLRSEPGKQIYFVPVGINFDRVLEDRNLLATRVAPGFLQKLRSFAGILLRTPILLASVFARAALRAHRKYGYAAVAFGPPIPLSELCADPAALARLPRGARLDEVARIADLLLAAVGRVIPATPVVLLARAVHEAGSTEIITVRRAVRREIATCRETGRPLGFGLAYTAVRAATPHDGGDKESLDRDLILAEEAELTVDLALSLLRLRGLVRTRDGHLHLAADAGPLLDYYARSLDPPSQPAVRNLPIAQETRHERNLPATPRHRSG